MQYANEPPQMQGPYDYNYGQFKHRLNNQVLNQDGQNLGQMDQQRMRDRIGYYNKFVDNA